MTEPQQHQNQPGTEVADPVGGLRPVSTRVMNLATFLTQAARRDPQGVALAMGDAHWDWAGFEARAAALAAGLARDYGVTKGERVLVQSQNSLWMLAAMFAAWRLGAVWVPANFRQTPDELVFQAQSSGAALLLCDAAFPDHAAAVTDRCPGLRARLWLGPESPEPGAAPQAGETIQTLATRFQGQSQPPASVGRDDPCWFFYTSGTTGRPKAAVLTNGQMAFVVTNHLADLMPGLTSADASLVLAPLSHGAGVHFLTQVARGVKSVLLPPGPVDMADVWRLIGAWRISTMFTVPTILKRLVEDPAAATADSSSLRYVIYAGAPMYRVDQQKALARLGKVLVQYFGLGEVTGAITVLPPHLHEAEDGPLARVGTCGYARTGIEVQIQDETGAELPPGATGEICCTGPAVFAGYYDNPEANADAFRDGWFRTGDLGHMDEAGFIWITGRRSDMYISGGSNIHPREVEEKLLHHPELREVAVLGMPDPDWGEVGWAICVPQPGCSPDPAALAAWLAPQIARYKQPRRFLIWDELPKSAYGKITRKLIRAQIDALGLTPDHPHG